MQIRLFINSNELSRSDNCNQTLSAGTVRDFEADPYQALPNLNKS